ncbi:putative AT-hook motif nuclear-localized protein [Helianthus debilis subsp. tardiflorus]
MVTTSGGGRVKILQLSDERRIEPSNQVPLKIPATPVSWCDWVSSSVGARFVPHIINVHTGEDVTMKVMSFSQHGPRAICILSANGVISSVTLR